MVVEFVSLRSLPARAVFAQTTAQINGTVRDQSGRVLPGVEIKATQTATGAVRTAISDETGSYVLPNLPIGPYMLEVSLPGFRTYVQTGIVLQVSSNPVDQCGPRSGSGHRDGRGSSQRRTGGNAQHRRRNGHRQPARSGDAFERTQRNRTDLPGGHGKCRHGSGTTLNSVRNYPTVIDFRRRRDQRTGITYQLDGSEPQRYAKQPESSVAVSGCAAGVQGGNQRLAGAVRIITRRAVNAVTKSGTNEFHGDVFEFVRNGVFNARNFFAPRRDTLKRNQFGGVIGGPIMKNKLFFFGGYQGTIQRSERRRRTSRMFRRPQCSPEISRTIRVAGVQRRPADHSGGIAGIREQPDLAGADSIRRH